MRASQFFSILIATIMSLCSFNLLANGLISQSQSNKRFKINYQNKSFSKALVLGKMPKNFSDREPSYLEENLNYTEIEKSVFENGSGLVFSPDPLSILRDKNLSNESKQELFEKAYSSVVLKDISKIDGLFYLKNSKVQLGDWDFPNNPDTTSQNGRFNFERGEAGFLDTMAFYHLNEAIDYIESLGFKNIFKSPIKVDTNASNGWNFSYYFPKDNLIGLGQGCIDDAEDADVLWYFFFQALVEQINPKWVGGDQDAVRAALGDYFAASRSFEVLKGKEYLPNEVFQWSGKDRCHGVRKLNVTDVLYEERRIYSSGDVVGQNWKAEELFSTPLYQSLLKLTDLGYSTRDLDKIVVQSIHGLTPGLKMRDIADKIVEVAAQLFPGKPHSEILKTQFGILNILELPKAHLFLGQIEVSDSGKNGVPDPGEEVELFASLGNDGATLAEQVNVELLTSKSKYEVLQSKSDYPDINVGYFEKNYNPFKIKLSNNLKCGEMIKIPLQSTYKDYLKRESAFEFELSTGVTGMITEIKRVAQPIPDNSTTGIESTLNLNEKSIIFKDVSIEVNISHSHTEDLEIELVSPKGTRVRLWNHKSLRGELIGKFPQDFMPEESLDKLIGEPATGDWKFIIKDTKKGFSGHLVRWGISTQSKLCE